MCQARKGKGWLDCQPDFSGTTGHEKAAEIKNKKKGFSRLLTKSPML